MEDSGDITPGKKHIPIFFLWLAGALITILVLSVAYYFVIALPHYNNQKLELEKHKIYNDSVETAKRDAEAKTLNEFREQQYQNCVSDANEKYWEFIKRNGTYNEKTNNISAPDHIWDRAERMKKNMLDECYRQFGKKE